MGYFQHSTTNLLALQCERLEPHQRIRKRSERVSAIGICQLREPKRLSMGSGAIRQRVRCPMCMWGRPISNVRSNFAARKCCWTCGTLRARKAKAEKAKCVERLALETGTNHGSASPHRCRSSPRAASAPPNARRIASAATRIDATGRRFRDGHLPDFRALQPIGGLFLAHVGASAARIYLLTVGP